MQFSISRWYVSLKNVLAMNEWIFLSCMFSMILLAVRMIVTGRIDFIFLPWNLFLAYIPYRLTEWLAGSVRVLENKIQLILLLVVWLLFIPNAFYIITDLFHIAKGRSAPSWFDLLLVFSFAWNGILFGVRSLRRVECIVNVTLGQRVSFIMVLIVMWLIAWGMYIGRYLRFNSWDILTDPFALAGELLEMIVHPFDHMYGWGMSVCYAFFMTLLYFSIVRPDTFAKTKSGQ
ncbi:MAG: DUF1361 domain-containing protein [Bacteroidetes bacterium]|nr:DUF1361 domain-containing protein [Bacteroidota bacterium]